MIEYVVGENGCWNRTFPKANDKGYPMVKVNGKQYRVYRYFYLQLKGEIPKGMHVMHTCDNRKCINPNHLVLGTAADNVRDMVSKERQAKGNKIHSSVLSVEKVLFIMKNRKSKTRTAIGKILGVSRSAVRDVILGKTWMHLTRRYDPDREDFIF